MCYYLCKREDSVACFICLAVHRIPLHALITICVPLGGMDGVAGRREIECDITSAAFIPMQRGVISLSYYFPNIE